MKQSIKPSQEMHARRWTRAPAMKNHARRLRDFWRSCEEMVTFIRVEIFEAVQAHGIAIKSAWRSKNVLRFALLFLLLNPVFLLALVLSQVCMSGLEIVIDNFRSPPNFGGSATHIRLDWLERRVTQEEAESANNSFPNRPRIDGLPFGFCNGYWLAMMKYMVDRDELWFYHSRNESNPEWGYAIVRNGQPVARMQASPDWSSV